MTRRKFMPGDRVLVGKGKFGRPPVPAVVAAEWDGESQVMVLIEGKTKALPRSPSMLRHAELERGPALKKMRAPRSSTTKATLRAVPRPSAPSRSEKYLAFIRTKPCAACKREKCAPVEPHHWAPRNHAMGRKVSDFHTVPLGRPCHDAYHDRGSLPGLDVRTTRELFLTAQSLLMEEFLSDLQARSVERAKTKRSAHVG